MSASRGKTIAIASGALCLLVLAAAGFAFRDLIREQWLLYKLRGGYREERIEAARSLGEMRCARAAPALVEAFRELSPTNLEQAVFQEALLRMGRSSLVALVRAIPWEEIASSTNPGEIYPRLYTFVHETIEILYTGKRRPEAKSQMYFDDLKRILAALAEGTGATAELREAIREKLKSAP